MPYAMQLQTSLYNVWSLINYTDHTRHITVHSFTQ